GRHQPRVRHSARARGVSRHLLAVPSAGVSSRGRVPAERAERGRRVGRCEGLPVQRGGDGPRGGGATGFGDNATRSPPTRSARSERSDLPLQGGGESRRGAAFVFDLPPGGGGRRSRLWLRRVGGEATRRSGTRPLVVGGGSRVGPVPRRQP